MAQDNCIMSKSRPTVRWQLMAAWCVFVVVSGTFLTIAGTYGTAVDINRNGTSRAKRFGTVDTVELRPRGRKSFSEPISHVIGAFGVPVH